MRIIEKHSGYDIAPADPELFTTAVVQGYSRSTTRVFKFELFEFQLMRWLSQTTYSGAEIGECLSTANKIKDGDIESWLAEWRALAERVEQIGHDCLARGHRVSAREAFLRATTYYEASFFFAPDNDPRKLELYRRQRDAFKAAGALFDHPFEVVAIPYEGGKTLPGYFLAADDSGRPRPTIMINTGGDGTSERMYFSGGAAAGLRRGYNVLLWDGPGQPGTYLEDRSLVFRPDWEVPAGSALDYLGTRGDVDHDRIAYAGYSMGGYFVPRTAGHDHRIAAGVALTLTPESWPSLPQVMKMKEEWFINAPAKDELDPKTLYAINEMMPRFGYSGGVSDLPAWGEYLKLFSCAGLEDKITCPILAISTTGEGKLFFDNAKGLFDRLPNPGNRFVLTTADDGGEMHCVRGNSSLAHQITYDWLDEVLTATSAHDARTSTD
jgi:pimeloyl-ACP methyl ester carboxylesterase